MTTQDDIATWRKDFLEYVETWPDESLLILFRIYSGNMKPAEVEKVEDIYIKELGRLVKNLEGPRGREQLSVIRDALEHLVEEFTL